MQEPIIISAFPGVGKTIKKVYLDLFLQLASLLLGSSLAVCVLVAFADLPETVQNAY